MPRELTATEQGIMNQAAASGNRVLYWQTLALTGDPYALTALQVVTDSTLFGRGANSFIAEQKG